MEKVFALLEKLPTYSVDRVPRMSDVKRALRLAGLLVHEGIDVDVDEQVRHDRVKKLKELRDKCAAEQADVNEMRTRAKTRKLQSASDLESLFG